MAFAASRFDAFWRRTWVSARTRFGLSRMMPRANRAWLTSRPSCASTGATAVHGHLQPWHAHVPLGVDLECRQRKVNALPLAQRFFADSEFRYLQGLPSEIRAAAFLRLWTGKEAVLKALGRGISSGLDKVVLSVSPEQELCIASLALSAIPDKALLQLQSLPVPRQNAFAALAWLGGPCRIVHFRHGAPLAESAFEAPQTQDLPS